jgi:hypothetical protein
VIQIEGAQREDQHVRTNEESKVKMELSGPEIQIALLVHVRVFAELGVLKLASPA